MDYDEIYTRQVRLLIKCLPTIDAEKCFALKGGTAINLFVMDLPRLSVDIDLAYVPVNERNTDLKKIAQALHRIIKGLTHAGLEAKMQQGVDTDARIYVRDGDALVKIEVNHVWRGLLNPPVQMDIKDDIADIYGFASINVVSLPDLYGGKICAAMDRQHPRDLFDVKLLMENSGLTHDIYYGFLSYLLGHPRPMAEVMSPHWKDLTQTFAKEFTGMAAEPLSLQAIQAVPAVLVAALKDFFSDKDRRFLLSYEMGEPDWQLFPHDLSDSPAILWKQQNLNTLKEINPEKWKQSLDKLKRVLDSWMT